MKGYNVQSVTTKINTMGNKITNRLRENTHMRKKRNTLK